MSPLKLGAINIIHQVWVISENCDQNYRADARLLHVFTGSTGDSIFQ